MDQLIELSIKNILDSLGVSYRSIDPLVVAGQRVFSIQTDDSRSVIGPHGDTIHAIDHLVKKIVDHEAEKTGSGKIEPFLVDVAEYRSKQIKDLAAKAMMMAERARSFRYDVELSPMTAYERLIVHAALAHEPHVKTESQGEGRGRRVVIKYVE